MCVSTCYLIARSALPPPRQTHRRPRIAHWEAALVDRVERMVEPIRAYAAPSTGARGGLLQRVGRQHARRTGAGSALHLLAVARADLRACWLCRSNELQLGVQAVGPLYLRWSIEIAMRGYRNATCPSKGNISVQSWLLWFRRRSEGRSLRRDSCSNMCRARELRASRDASVTLRQAPYPDDRAADRQRRGLAKSRPVAGGESRPPDRSRRAGRPRLGPQERGACSTLRRASPWDCRPGVGGNVVTVIVLIGRGSHIPRYRPGS
jgi:hypothetical protein